MQAFVVSLIYFDNETISPNSIEVSDYLYKSLTELTEKRSQIQIIKEIR
jgi:hypothetical protein